MRAFQGEVIACEGDVGAGETRVLQELREGQREEVGETKSGKACGQFRGHH